MFFKRASSIESFKFCSAKITLPASVFCSEAQMVTLQKRHSCSLIPLGSRVSDPSQLFFREHVPCLERNTLITPAKDFVNTKAKNKYVNSTAPAAQKPPGWQRPQINTPRSIPPTPPPRQRPSATLRPTYPARPTPPTLPPRGSSFDDRYRGHSGDRNTIGGNSIWDRLFGGGGSKPKPSSPSGGGGSSGFFDRPTSKPSGSNYYPGGKDKYNTHVSTDSNGNRQWTFSG
ncbi:hypothetical protein QAD02_017538 [Eretmocerus hayati]|uniref:Uncharacterized protein n=1 Tax=Eretmocerus hayati TaxID=131215 RepID=A0ACC2PFZ5_9HYME|nr:hypothetical protein QAD02_017538 [Eretmocerus hayati]